MTLKHPIDTKNADEWMKPTCMIDPEWEKKMKSFVEWIKTQSEKYFIAKDDAHRFHVFQIPEINDGLNTWNGVFGKEYSIYNYDGTILPSIRNSISLPVEYIDGCPYKDKNVESEVYEITKDEYDMISRQIDSLCDNIKNTFQDLFIMKKKK